MAFVTITSTSTPIEVVKYNNGSDDIVSLRVCNHSASFVMSSKEAGELADRIQAVLAQPSLVAA